MSEMSESPRYSKESLRTWFDGSHPEIKLDAEFLAYHLNLAFNIGRQVGFEEGESKQAILELRGRDRFLSDLRKQFEQTGKI